MGSLWKPIRVTVPRRNTFGGYKRSGLRRESGKEATYEYLQQKSVWISTATDVTNPFVLR
jgi:acyl-CoA reductase-like NAD-dependent aldehyde dehydrogenase